MTNKSRTKGFPPPAYLALVGRRALEVFRQGYRPSRDISASQMYALAGEWRNAGDERRAMMEQRNIEHSGGVQHATVIYDRAQLAFVVACLEDYEEPISCQGLTHKLRTLRDSLVGDVEEIEAAPYLKGENPENM